MPERHGLCPGPPTVCWGVSDSWGHLEKEWSFEGFQESIEKGWSHLRRLPERGGLDAWEGGFREQGHCRLRYQMLALGPEVPHPGEAWNCPEYHP